MRSVKASVLALILAAGPAAAACRAPDEPGLAGLYTLEGLFEVGSQFILYPDGRFEFMLAYGAVDQYGRGCWTTEREGWVLLLPNGRRRVPEVTLPSDRRFRGMALRRDGEGGLEWLLPGDSGTYRKSDG